MARAVFSTRFFTVIRSSGTSANHFTVPANQVAVIRCVDFLADAAGSQVGLYDGAAGVVFFATPVLGTSLQSVQWTGRQVFEAGVSFGSYWFSGQMTIRASGYLLTA